MDRKIIIALIIIVLIALAGLLAFSSGIKTDTQIDFLTGSTLKNGDQVQFELKDAQGNALANQEVKITFTGKDEKQNFTITTDENGRGALILKDENSGNYTVSVSYDGDDKHNGCSNNFKIMLKDNETAETSDDYSYDSSYDYSSDYSYSSYSDSSYSSESSESSSSNTIQGGQNDGIDADYLKTHQQKVVDGSLE